MMKAVLAIGLLLFGLCQTLKTIDLSALKYLEVNYVTSQLSAVLASYSLVSGETQVVECEALVVRHIYINDIYRKTIIVLVDKNQKWVASQQLEDGEWFQVVQTPSGGFAWYNNKYTPTLYLFNTYEPNPIPHNIYTDNFKRGA